MYKRGILIFITLLICISFVSSACPEGEGYLGNKELNECVRITQTCASCSFVNISSIILTTSNVSLTSNVGMTSFGNGEWIYDFCNTSSFGNYFIQGMGDLEGTNTNFKSCFDIGQNMTIPESIIYVLFTVILFGLFLTMLFFITTLPNENSKNENDVVIGIVKLKYIRILLIAICYPVFLIMLNLLNGLAINFASLGIFAGTLSFFFQTLMSLAWVFTVIIILWIFYLLIKDSNVQKNIDKLGRFRV